MKEKNFIIVVGGVILIFLTVAILSMLVLNVSFRGQPSQQGGSYSAPIVNQGGESEMSVMLSALNASGESGTATLNDASGMVTVTLNLTGYTPSVVQPAHIHVGACPGVGAVKYPLNSVVNGKSVTVLDVSMAQLKQQLPLAINVHKSAAEVAVYTSCGSL